MIIVRRASFINIPEITNLLNHALERKHGYNDPSWGTEEFTANEVREMLGSTRVYIAATNGKVVGVVSITNKDQLWTDNVGPDPDPAWYIHRLSSSTTAKGQNVGGLLIQQLEDDARRQGTNALRLDCSYENKGLYDYYVQKGFEEVARKELHSTKPDVPVYPVAFMQKNLA
jgi:predicted N-acetyltransferase YhbS